MTNEYFAPFFKGTNFGSTDYVELIREGLKKVITGYSNGHTMNCILLDLKYVEKRGVGDYFATTDLGLDVYVKIVLPDEEIEKMCETLKKSVI